MTWIFTAVGALMIVAALRDIFHTLWHPAGFGTLARAVFSVIWRGTKLLNRHGRSTGVSGPAGVLLTLVVWTALLAGGFALIYLPHMPQDFFFGSSLRPKASSDLVGSLYLSLVALTTLGLGDIQPATPLLRLLVPAEALLGFLLLTAGISWILQLYPALTRRRALARQLATMARHDAAEVVETGEASIAVQHLESVRAELAGVEMDLLQHAESYYFREVMSEISLPAVLSEVLTLAAAGERSASPEVRNAGLMLRTGLDELLELVRREFLGNVGDAEATLAALAADHQQDRLSPS